MCRRRWSGRPRTSSPWTRRQKGMKTAGVHGSSVTARPSRWNWLMRFLSSTQTPPSRTSVGAFNAAIAQRARGSAALVDGLATDEADTRPSLRRPSRAVEGLTEARLHRTSDCGNAEHCAGGSSKLDEAVDDRRMAAADPMAPAVRHYATGATAVPAVS